MIGECWSIRSIDLNRVSQRDTLQIFILGVTQWYCVKCGTSIDHPSKLGSHTMSWTLPFTRVLFNIKRLKRCRPSRMTGRSTLF